MGCPRRTVLIVDDDTKFCELMVAVLGESGYRVIVATDLPTLTPILTTREVDIAVVDLMWPAGSVLACQRIREILGVGVPLVLRAPIADLLGREEVQALSAEDCVVCPYYIEELVERIDRLCSSAGDP